MISNFEGLKKENGNNTYLRLVWQVAMWHINASYLPEVYQTKGRMTNDRQCVIKFKKRHSFCKNIVSRYC